MPGRGVFLCYRRDDTMAAGRLYGDLCEIFGEEFVFRDVNSIASGNDWRKAIDAALEKSAIQLVLIGPGWVRPELQRTDNVVRYEIEKARERRMAVVPIVLERAPMPTPSEVPASLHDLLNIEASFLTDRHWSDDVKKLAALVEREGVPRRRSARPNPLSFQLAWATMALLVIAVALVLGEAGYVRECEAWWGIGPVCATIHGHLLNWMPFRYVMYGVLIILGTRLILTIRPKRLTAGDVLLHVALAALVAEAVALIFFSSEVRHDPRALFATGLVTSGAAWVALRSRV